MEGWRYYKHSLLPTISLYEELDLNFIKKDFWKDKKYKNVWFIRYCTDIGTDEDTGWWQCIKDEPFDFLQVKSKRRTRIRKGTSLCAVHRIDPSKYAEQLAEITLQGWKNYEKAIKSNSTRKDLISSYLEQYDEEKVHWWGVFKKDTHELCGYGQYFIYEDYVNQIQVKVLPQYLDLEANAALVYEILSFYLTESGGNKKYITNGERNIVHNTNYPQYLMDTFGFRKINSRLHMIYRPWVRYVVSMAFPFRNLIGKCRWSLTRNLFFILKMEEISRRTKR